MKKFVLLLSLSLGLAQNAYLQVPTAAPASSLLHELQKLNVFGSVLYVAAHPDDENTRLISWLANEKKYRTAYLSLTRGDGGQNLIGDEQGVELGLIRTQELLAARRIDGGEQYFTRAYDFGYSKNPEETFQVWNRDSILADVVWMIRRFQPDVIITRFPTTGEGGHGHHTASAILANEAFQAAADPTRFTEQLKYVSVWQAKRILWNTFNFGGTNTTASNQFKIDVGGYNPLLGKSYGELAAESRSQHKSQGFGVPSSRGESFEYFKTTGGAAPETDLFDGIKTDWSRLPAASEAAVLVDQLIRLFDAQHPEQSLPGLIQLHAKISALPDDQWKSYKQKRLQKLILQAAGLYAEAIATQASVSHGDTLRFALNLIARSTDAFRLRTISYPGKESAVNVSLPRNKTYTVAGTFFISPEQPTTQPYWLTAPMQSGRFSVSDPLKIGLPENDPAYSVRLNVEWGGVDIDLDVPIVYKLTDPVRGEVFKPLVVRPQAEINAADELVFVTSDKQQVDLSIRMQANQSLNGLQIRAVAPNNTIELGDIQRMEKGEVISRSTKATAAPGVYTFEAYSKNDQMLTQAGRTTRIEYDHVPEIHYFRNTPQRVVPIQLKISGKRVGYIEGAGDKVADALERMGYEVVRLSQKELSKTDLSTFQAIITGVRAYNTHVWLNEAHELLMQYVSNGGNLIVQYNTSSQIGPVRAKIGPYPFSITRTRVTNETAPVKFLDPQHPVFNYPNKLTESDFNGWIQERSIYHGADTSGRFTRLIGMADPGEKSDDGSLLITRYGKGWFTYTGLALFRQLPAGVPGAHRLLANLIALSAKKRHE